MQLEFNRAAPMTTLNSDLGMFKCWPNLKVSNCKLQITKIKVLVSVIVGKLIAAITNHIAKRTTSVRIHFGNIL
jgi:hypothetical protein